MHNQAPGRLTAAEHLAQFTVDVGKRIEVPANALRAAEERVVDTIGVALAGSIAVNAERLQRELAAIGASHGGPCHLWASGATTTPIVAACVNATSAHAEDFDDTHTGGIVHGSACIVPAAWAAAERYGSSGDQLVTAVALGWEVAARIGLAAHGRFHERGWHTTSIAGAFGAAASVAWLARMTADQVVNVFGICGSLAGGLNAYLEDGANVKAFHAGVAAQAGLLAPAAALGRVTGPHRVFEGRSGVFEVFAQGDSDIAALAGGIGESWEILNVSTKPYPACHFAHAAIEAAATMRRRIDLADVTRVTCRVPKPTFPLICDPWEEKQRTLGGYGGKFSLPFLVSSALVDGNVDRETFSPARAERPEVIRLMRTATIEPLASSRFPAAYDGEVIVSCRDREICQRVDVNCGHPMRPLSQTDLDTKFLANARLVMTEMLAGQSLETLRRVRAAPALPVILGTSAAHPRDVGRQGPVVR